MGNCGVNSDRQHVTIDDTLDQIVGGRQQTEMATQRGQHTAQSPQRWPPTMAELLGRLGLMQLLPVCTKHEIDVDALLICKVTDLEEIGVPADDAAAVVAAVQAGSSELPEAAERREPEPEREQPREPEPEPAPASEPELGPLSAEYVVKVKTLTGTSTLNVRGGDSIADVRQRYREQHGLE